VRAFTPFLSILFCYVQRCRIFNIFLSLIPLGYIDKLLRGADSNIYTENVWRVRLSYMKKYWKRLIIFSFAVNTLYFFHVQQENTIGTKCTHTTLQGFHSCLLNLTFCILNWGLISILCYFPLAYIYPDFMTALLGSFVDGIMQSGQQVGIKETIIMFLWERHSTVANYSCLLKRQSTDAQLKTSNTCKLRDNQETHLNWTWKH